MPARHAEAALHEAPTLARLGLALQTARSSLASLHSRQAHAWRWHEALPMADALCTAKDGCCLCKTEAAAWRVCFSCSRLACMCVACLFRAQAQVVHASGP